MLLYKQLKTVLNYPFQNHWLSCALEVLQLVDLMVGR